MYFLDFLLAEGVSRGGRGCKKTEGGGGGRRVGGVAIGSGLD